MSLLLYGPVPVVEAPPITLTMPTIRSSAEASTGVVGNTISMAIPSGGTDGDLMIVGFASDAVGWDDPANAGFTTVHTDDLGNLGVYVGYRILQSGDTGPYVFTLASGAVDTKCGTAVCINGGTFNPADPINGFAILSDDTGADSVGNVPNVTTDSDECLGIAWTGADAVNHTSYPTTGGSPEYSNLQDQFVSGVSSRCASIPLAVAGSAGAGTFDINGNEQDFGILVAINPAQS